MITPEEAVAYLVATLIGLAAIILVVGFALSIFFVVFWLTEEREVSIPDALSDVFWAIQTVIFLAIMLSSAYVFGVGIINWLGKVL